MTKKMPLGLLVLIVMLLMLASTVSAAPPTVGVVTTADAGRDAAAEKVNPWTSNYLRENRVAIVSGPLVDQAVADIGVSLSAGQEKTVDKDGNITNPGVLPTVCSPEYLAKLGAKLGVDRMLGAHFKVWHRTHIGYRDGKCEVSYTVVDVKTGKILEAAISPAFVKAAENDASYIARAAVAGVGIATATGGVFGSAAYRTPFGYNLRSAGAVVALAALAIPFESRCDAELAAIRAGVEGTFQPLLPLLRRR